MKEILAPGRGSSLAGLILKAGYRWNDEFAGKALSTDNLEVMLLTPEITLRLLSPASDKLEGLYKQWRKELYRMGYTANAETEIFFDDALNRRQRSTLLNNILELLRLSMKGYINKVLADLLFDDGIQLINAAKRNMKQKALSNEEKLLLCKWFVIKTVKDELKNIYQVEHTRHRSIAGFFLNIMSTIEAYSLPHNLLLKRISKKLILLLYNNSISQN